MEFEEFVATYFPNITEEQKKKLEEKMDAAAQAGEPLDIAETLKEFYPDLSEEELGALEERIRSELPEPLTLPERALLHALDIDKFYERYLPGITDEVKAEIEEACLNKAEGMPIEDFVERFMRDRSPEEREKTKKELFALSKAAVEELQELQ